jgi:NADH dehydrogenase (ubiquinone) flavoprotein 2
VNNAEIPFQFNAENSKRAKDIISKYPPQYKKGACMPLLDLGQRQQGFTSISVMNHVAELLDMAPMRVYEVATFYTMYNRYFLSNCEEVLLVSTFCKFVLPPHVNYAAQQMYWRLLKMI